MSRLIKISTRAVAVVAVGFSTSPAPHAEADVFEMCPDGREGVVGGHTTCAFAENVRRAFYASGMANEFIAYSPVTGERYEMACEGMFPATFSDGAVVNSTRCYGGSDAEVVIW